MFSRIQAFPAAFAGTPIPHSFGNEDPSAKPLVGMPAAVHQQDMFSLSNDSKKALQNTVQPPDMEPSKRSAAKPPTGLGNRMDMSYTAGWMNPINPTLGGSPIPHSDQGFASPRFQTGKPQNFQARTQSNHFAVPISKHSEMRFRGFEQHQPRPAFMATIADYPIMQGPGRRVLNHPATPHNEAAAEKARVVKSHKASSGLFATNLPYQSHSA